MAFEGLSDKLSNAFQKLRSKGRLTENDVKESMREIRLALLEADVSYKVVKDFTKQVTARAVGADVLESLTPAQMIVKIVNEELCRLMGSENQKIQISSSPPTVVMLVGLQGAGKTTNGAKLAGLMQKQGKRPLLAACDVYRPAAIKQLEVVGEKLGIEVFQMGTSNPVDIAKAAVEYAKKHGFDMVFLDTAGRLHIDEALMEELKAIKAAVEPAETMLVVDAMTGQDAVNAAQSFNDLLDIDSVMLTKLDGDARGGAALSVKADVLTLIEKAEQAMDAKKAKELEERLKNNKFTLTDYYDQLMQLKGMGSLDEILGMMPGMNSAAMKNVKVDEGALTRTEAIILSMTPYERENPSCLNHSRKRRIAAGSGVKVEEINKLLKSYEMMRNMIRQFSAPGAKKKMKRMGKGGFPNLGGMGGFPGF